LVEGGAVGHHSEREEYLEVFCANI